MIKLHRSALVAAFLAFGAVACGDDVVVSDPPATPLSVSLTPAGQTVNVGATVDFIVSISGGEGTATWTCTSSSPSVASVAVTESGCRATALTGGSTTISVAVTKGSETNSAGAALQVNDVSDTPATVTISRILQGGVDAPIGNIAGQIDVVLNIDRGDEQLERVAVLVDGVEVAAQQLGPAAVFEEVEGPDGQATQQITLSFATNFYTIDAAAGTSTVRHFNGDRTVSANLFVSGVQAPTPSNTVPLTFANISGFHVLTTLPTNSAMAANGLIWYGGPGSGTTDITAIPVIYTENAEVSSVTITFCGNSTDTSAPFTFSRACATQEGAITPTFTSVVSGNAGPTTIINGTALFGLEAHPFPVRIDNVGPGAPVFMANPRIRQNGWINGGVGLVGLNTGSAATANNWLVAGAADAGVGGYVTHLRIDSTAPATVAAANAAEASSEPDLPDPSLNNNDYCAVASAKDLLGNESARPANATACLPPPVATNTNTATSHLRFGVDIVAPTIAFHASSLAANALLNGGTVGGEFVLTVADTGSIGVSGMLGGAPVVGSVRQYNAASPLPGACFFGTGGACTMAALGGIAFPLVSTTTVAAAAVPAYYIGSFVSQDAAGNQSDTVTRDVAFDQAANVPALTAALFNTPLSGNTATFTALASDNFDLASVQYSLGYAGGLTFPILYPAVILNQYPPVPGTLVNSNVSAGITIDGFMRQVENVTGNAPLAVGGQFKPNNLQGWLSDQVGNLAGPVNTAIPAASVTTGVSYTAAAAAQLIDSWAITGPGVATNVSDGAAATPANPTSVTLVVDAFGPTATFNAPFTRVDFYVDNGVNLVQIGTGTPGSTFDDGSPQGRRHRWTFNFTPGTTFGVGNLSIYAIGVNAAGDGLVSPVDNNITVTNP